MKQFDLSEYLDDPSRKVCTREGDVVEIIFWKGKGDFPVIVIDPNEQETEPWQVTNNGKVYNDGDDSDLDLFFVDEEEELTEFEKELKCAIVGYHQAVEREEITSYSQDDDFVREFSNRLLDLARKQLQPEFDKVMDKLLEKTDKWVIKKTFEL